MDKLGKTFFETEEFEVEIETETVDSIEALGDRLIQILQGNPTEQLIVLMTDSDSDDEL